MDKIEWDNIVMNEVVKIRRIPPLVSNTIVISALEKEIIEIFDNLRRLENKKFYSDEDVENIFCFLSGDIFYMNDMLVKSGNAVLVEVYQLMLNIFDRLIRVTEVEEDYETAKNLLMIRDYWYNYFGIKIKRRGVEK